MAIHNRSDEAVDAALSLLSDEAINGGLLSCQGRAVHVETRVCLQFRNLACFALVSDSVPACDTLSSHHVLLDEMRLLSALECKIRQTDFELCFHFQRAPPVQGQSESPARFTYQQSYNLIFNAGAKMYQLERFNVGMAVQANLRSHPD